LAWTSPCRLCGATDYFLEKRQDRACRCGKLDYLAFKSMGTENRNVRGKTTQPDGSEEPQLAWSLAKPCSKADASASELHVGARLRRGERAVIDHASGTGGESVKGEVLIPSAGCSKGLYSS
jgi:hypothetical protein